MGRRVFLIVLDSLGIGWMPDAGKWGDEGSDTLAAARRRPAYRCPALERLGLLRIDGVGGADPSLPPAAAYARLTEASAGKDTTVGHWEIAGLISRTPLPTYPDGFPAEITDEFTRRTGYGILCNRPYSGTEVIRDFGEEHLRTGKLIVYTSADSVFQVAAHEDLVPVPELYRVCTEARAMLTGRHGVGRVIARPFTGRRPFVRTPRRRDFSLPPFADTMLDVIRSEGLDCLAVGKITDIFAGRGVTESFHTSGNGEGMAVTAGLLGRDFHGLCFTNLVDFDMLYGHRNDADGYARALAEFDLWLADFLPRLGAEDLLMITADHGCDPSTPSTDHSREYVPWLLYGAPIAPVNLGTRGTFADVAATTLDYLGLPSSRTAGVSVLPLCWRRGPAPARLGRPPA